MQAKTEDLVTADYAGSGSGWGNNDPSVFVISFSGKLEGEFQVTNGYGPKKAPQVMQVRDIDSTKLHILFRYVKTNLLGHK